MKKNRESLCLYFVYIWLDIWLTKTFLGARSWRKMRDALHRAFRESGAHLRPTLSSARQNTSWEPHGRGQ